jgi:hypothetical protein
MKNGRSITELAAEIERQANAKRDLVASTSVMGMLVDGDEVKLAIGNAPENRFAINDLAHDQIGVYTKIPAPYYDRMLAEDRNLLQANVNRWLRAEPKDKRLARTLDGSLRAFMSDAYRPLENVDLLEAILPPLIGSGAEIVSCEVTERRLYIKAVDKTVQREIEKKTGHRLGDGSSAFFKDILCPAITIQNSEVGAGALAVNAAVWTQGCTNLAVMKEKSIRKTHVGGRHEIGANLIAQLSDQTRKLKDAALWSEIRDVVKVAFDEAKFSAHVKRISGMVEDKIEGDPVEVVEMTRRHFQMRESEGKSVLRHLIEGGDLTRYGLFNAITRTAEDLESYDRASEFERLGGEVIELEPREWKRIAQAA